MVQNRHTILQSRTSTAAHSPTSAPKQLEPLRIGLLDQFYLPLPWPALQRFLALDRIANVEVLLEPHEPLHPVARREPRSGPALMLEDSAANVVGETDIDRAALLAGSHVDVAGHAKRLTRGHPAGKRLNP